MAKVKKGGRALTGILCFIFGIIFGLVVLVAAVAAGIYFLLNSDIDDVLSTVGVENTDEDGNKIYINTNLDELTTVYDLIGTVSSLASDFDAETTTLNDLDGYFPAIGLAVDKIYDAVSGVLSDYMTEEEFEDIFDKDSLMSTAIAGLSDFFYSSMMNANVDIIFNIAGIDIESNVLLMALAYGTEATVAQYNGETVVLSLDKFYTEEGQVTEDVEEGEGETTGYALLSTEAETEGEEQVTYLRDEDGTELNDDYAQYVVEEANGTYSLYCYVTDDGTAYIAQMGEDGTFTVTSTIYSQYSSEYTAISGAYWYDGDALNIISSRSIGDIVGEDADILSVFDEIYISDIIAGFSDGEDNDMLDLLDGYTFGDVISGNISLDTIMDKVYIPDYIDVSADNAIMMYFGYAMTEVESVEVESAGYQYTGTINTYTEIEDGEESDKWAVSTATAYIVVDEGGNVTGVYYDEALTEEYNGVSASELTALMDNFMDALYVKDIIEISEDDSKLIRKLGDYKLGELTDAMDDIVLSDVIEEVYTDDAIIAYMVYGISGITQDGDSWSATYHCLDEDCENEGTHDVTVEVDTENENSGYLITGVYYETTDEEGNAVKVEAVTNINDVSARVNGMLDDLTIGEIIEVEESDTILWALRNSTINSLATDVAALTVQELFADDIYGGTDEEGGSTGATLYEVVESDACSGSNQIQFSSDYLYYHKDSEGNLTLAGNNGHLCEYTNDGGTLYTYGAPKGVWKLLLYGEDGYEEAVTVNEVAGMQNNVLTNLQNSTLDELHTMGIITGEDVESTLNTSITYEEKSTTIGALTISEFLGYVGSLELGEEDGDGD